MGLWSDIFSRLTSSSSSANTRNGLKRGDFCTVTIRSGDLKFGQEVLVSSVYNAYYVNVVDFDRKYHKIHSAYLKKI